MPNWYPMGGPILPASTCISLSLIYPNSCCPFTCICENAGSSWNLPNVAKEATVRSKEKVAHNPLSVDQSPQFSTAICFSLWFSFLQTPNGAPPLRKPTSQDFLPIILNFLKLSSSIQNVQRQKAWIIFLASVFSSIKCVVVHVQNYGNDLVT